MNPTDIIWAICFAIGIIISISNFIYRNAPSEED